MKENLVEMVFILDRSGSMSGLEEDTIGGFNAMIAKQKQLPGEAVVSTVLFDHVCKVLHHRLPLEVIKPLTLHDYEVRGTTALLDAMGRGIDQIKKVHRSLPKAERPEKTIFVITTDGLENASRSYTYEAVCHMVSHQKEADGWEFIFLGANIDAIMTASRFGIDASRAANYHADKDGVHVQYESLNEAITSLRLNKSLNAKWKSAIDKDDVKRK